MTAISVKRWIVLLVGLVLFLGAGIALQKYQVKKLARSVASDADIAAEKGEFEKAESLYEQHLNVIPDDVDIQIKYADILAKVAPSLSRQSEALQIYGDILRRFPGRDEVRRRQMELKFAMNRLQDDGAEADLKVLLKLPKYQEDGNLMFMLARCYEEGKNYTSAAQFYENAIKHNAQQKIEAYARLANLLRSPERLNDPKAGDKAIEEMVKSAPDNYAAYLARGRYRSKFNLPGSRADFEKALTLADDKPEIYAELSRIAESELGYLEAKKILETGLSKFPASAELYVMLSDLEQRNGHTEAAIAILERGVQSPAEKTAIRWLLAISLATRGDTGKLRLQIEELRASGISQIALQYLTAHYHANLADYRKARQILIPLESAPGLRPEFKSRISNLLARCYSQLGEPAMQHEAYVRALSANPNDVNAKLGLIDRMIKQGDLEEAIKEYRSLAKIAPGVNIPLAQQLIARNLQRPVAQRDWTEVKTAIDHAEKALPESAEPLILRADYFIAQEQRPLAREELAKARKRFPKSAAVRCAEANLLVNEKKIDEAVGVLDDARKELGDGLELRLQRAKLAVLRGGPQVVAELSGLSKNLESFSRSDRRKLLTGLAIEFVRLQDLPEASRVWAMLVEQEPTDIDVRLNLLDLAFQTANTDQINKTIKEIEQIEGPDGSLGPLCQVQYLIWQAERLIEKDPEEARRLRSKARGLINDVVARRADWSAIPMALAQLEKQELRQEEVLGHALTEREVTEKEENIIRYYRRAIDLGQRNSTIVRETVKLLFKHKRGSDALELVNSIPVASQLASDLGRQALSFAVENRDYERAEQIARKAVAANPADLQERVLLVRILLNRGRQAEAEQVLREAVNLAKTDPDRWIVMVQFLVFTKQPAKASQAIDEAEHNLSPAQAPITLGQCCAQMGKSFEATDQNEMNQWYARARAWYEKAVAAQPDDLANVRRLTDFLIQTGQRAEVEAQLRGILKRDTSNQNSETKAWAKRMLATALASSNDPEKVRNALAVIEPTAPSGSAATTLVDPEDLRTLARVLEAQKTVGDRNRAISVLDQLVARNVASVDDRFMLARLHEFGGNWQKALEIYRDLNKRTKNPRDLESLNRRSVFLAQFTRSILRNHKAGNDQELLDAQDLVDELAQLQPDALDTLSLRIDVYRARNQLDRAADLIQLTSRRPNLSPIGVKSLALLAERLDRLELAEQICRQYSTISGIQDGTSTLALFLGRHGRLKEALDLYEPLWQQPGNAEVAAGVCAQLIASAAPPAEPAQVERVTKLIESALARNKESSFLLVTLANLREHQGRFEDAEGLYRSAVERAPGIAPVAGNANQILAMAYNNLGWLMALKDGDGKVALTNINRAIELVGSQPDFLDTRGVIYLGLKQTKDAISDLETATKAAPSPSKLFHLAQAYQQSNEMEKAKQCLREAKARGLDRIGIGPGGLHSLEQTAYQKLASQLGIQ